MKPKRPATTTPVGSPEPDVRIFFSYAHADPILYKSLLDSLLRWPSVKTLTKWSDNNIEIGTVPDKEIRAELKRMDIFVALITPMFAASRYITEVEVPEAKRRWEKGHVKVVPIVITHPGKGECDWLLGLEWLPDTKNRKSWAELRKADGAKGINEGECDTTLVVIRDAVRRIVDQVRAEKKRHP